MTTTSISEYDGCGAVAQSTQVLRPAFLAGLPVVGHRVRVCF